MTATAMNDPRIDPRSELSDVLDAILRDLGQLVHYDQVRILLLPSVLDMERAGLEDEESTLLISVRESGELGTLQGTLEPSPLGYYPLNRLLMFSQKPIVIADTWTHELWVSGAQHEAVRAWIGAPLVVKGESIGVLALHSLTPNAFTERDGIIVFAFASQAAEAIDKVRLLDQAQNRLHAMMALYEASLDVLRHSQEPDRLLQTLVRRAVDLLRAESGGIFLLDPDRTSLRLAIPQGFMEAYQGAAIKVGEGLAGQVFQAGQPQVVNDYQHWEGRTAPFSEDVRFSAMLAVPLRWETGVLGVLEICANAFLRKFNLEDRWLAELFANQVSMVMSNARLIEQSRRRLAELSALRDVSMQMTSTLDLDRVLDAICANVMSLTAAEDTHIYLFYDTQPEGVTKAVALWRSGLRTPTTAQHTGLIDRVRRTGRTIVIDDALRHELYAQPEAAAWGVKSIAGFPLKRAGQVLGVFTVSYLVLHRFGEDELRVLNLLANQASIAIDNALSYQKLQDALAERERTQQALIRSESLAAVGQLVAGVAHELNNPLASVSSLIQTSLETIGLPYSNPAGDSGAALPAIRPDSIKPLALEDLIEITDDLVFSLKELRRAKDIVSSLLDLSRQSQSYTEEVSLTIVCQDALRILRNRLKILSVEIVENYADDLPRVRGNFANLGQVALNLIQNAGDALQGRSAGRLEVGTGFDAARGIAWLSVEDTGPGIPAHVLPNIFHPFYTTKGVGVGTGLGLYISYEIVKKHNGEISVDTEMGRGTKFRVELPIIPTAG